jgi:hypothetical protein
MLKYFALPAVMGEMIDLAAWRRHSNLVVYFQHGVACAACQAIVADLAAHAEGMAGERAVLISVGPAALTVPGGVSLLDPDGVAIARQGLVAPALLITDRFGEAYNVWASDDHAFPSGQEVVEWLVRIERLCDECTTPEWDAQHEAAE